MGDGGSGLKLGFGRAGNSHVEFFGASYRS